MERRTYPPETPTPPPVPPRAAEEALVSDDRAGVRPAQWVERKLVSLLRTGLLPMSRLESARPPRHPA
jgi:hypothetical protein